MSDEVTVAEAPQRVVGEADPRAPRVRHRDDPIAHAEEATVLDLLTGIEERMTGRTEVRILGSPSFSRFAVAALSSRSEMRGVGAVHALEMKNPRRMGARFQLRGSDLANASLRVEFSCSIYYPVYPTWEEFHRLRVLGTDEHVEPPDERGTEGSGRTRRTSRPQLEKPPNCEKQLRMSDAWEVQLRDVLAAPEKQLELNMARLVDIRTEAAADPDVLKIRVAREEDRRFDDRLLKIPPEIFKAPDARAAYQRLVNDFRGEPCLPHWNGTVLVSLFDMGGDKWEVSVLFENNTAQEEFNTAWKGFLHDCKFAVHVDGADIVPQLLHHMGRTDYRVASHVTVTGIHCPVLADDRAIRNLQVPWYVQPLQEHVDRGGADLHFRTLAGDGAIAALERLHRVMVLYADDWARRYDEYVPETRRADGATRQAFQEAIQTFREEIQRFQEGITALKKDPRALQAFQLTNRVIGRANNFPGWRTFQLVFLVSLLRDVVARERADVGDDRRFVDVLWFPTGGGKTETYLGLISFSLVYDRLRGKHRGVSAWVKFPLRMLSLDQLDRFARVLVILNQARDEAKLPGEPFEIGYYMGDRNTPNRWFEATEFQQYGASPHDLAGRYARARADLGDAPEQNVAAHVFENTPKKDTRRFQLLEVCPHLECGKGVYVWLDRKTETTQIKCPTHGRLPIRFVDDEIYRHVPAILISTIDKLAIVAFNDSIRNLLVRPLAQCEFHGYLASRTCHACKRLPEADRAPNRPRTVSPEEFYDPAPAIQVQDELHLLREQLGSYNSHYESLIGYLHDALLTDPDMEVHRPRGPTKIIGATATITEYEQQIAHLYGRESRRFPQPGPTREKSFYTINKTTGRRIMAAIWPVNMSTKVAINEALVAYWFRFYARAKDLPGYRRILGTHGVEVGSLTDHQLLQVLDKCSTTIAYYTNKQKAYIGRREFQTAMPQAAENYSPDLIDEFRALASESLTGDSEFRDIRRIKSRLESGTFGSAAWLPHLAATSIISHGIDVSRLNAIIFSGMPADTAEYIQASSRVGRADLGLCLVVHDTSRDRDEVHFVNHRLYHDHQEFHVRGVAINRFSKYLIKRTFPGLFAALLRLYWNPTRPNEESRYAFTARDARPLHDALKDASVRNRMTDILTQFIGRNAADVDDLRNRINVVWDAMAREGYRNRAQSKSLFALFPDHRPLTNHREIEAAIRIGLDRDSGDFMYNSDWEPGPRVVEAPDVREASELVEPTDEES